MKKIALTLTMTMTLTAFAQEVEEPILTIACLSDIHSMNNMITPSSGKLEDIHPRTSFINTVKALKEQEDIDVLVLGGDYISDKTFAQANYNQHRIALADVARDAFQTGKKPYVLYMNGNHEYEVANFDILPKTWNAGDYYTTIMKNDVGELPEGDCFYEMADNGTEAQMKLLAAYYYKLYGYDFVVMNCAKYFFASAWTYSFSEESVNWVSNKLDAIYKDDPDKVVFFLIHLPFADSNSMNSGKGINVNTASNNLKKALAKHKNLIMLYGHDHGGEMAYSRRLTSQRATVYDTNCNVISSTDERHIDGTVPVEEDVTMPDAEGKVRCGEFKLYNASVKKYLILDSYNFNLSETAATMRVGAYKEGFAINYCPSARPFSCTYLSHSMTSLFSKGNATGFKLYRVENPEAKMPHAVLADGIKPGESYVVVNTVGTAAYALGGTVSSSGTSDQRISQIKVKLEADSIHYFYEKTAGATVWKFEGENEEGDEGKFYVWNTYANKYMSIDSYNLSLSATPLETKFALSGGNATATMSYGGTSYGLHIGSNGYYSRGDASQLMIFRVDTTSETPRAVRATSMKANEDYVIVGLYSAKYYAMYGSLTSAGTTSQRMLSTQVTIKDDTLSFSSPTIAPRAYWTMKDIKDTPAPTGESSFMSLFMGSMRYYYNSIDFTDPTDLPVIVQGLMVYVYSNRVVFQIKNYNQTGIINGNAIVEHPASYTLYFDKVDGIDDSSQQSSVNSSQLSANSKYYDLSGRSVSKLTKKGVYISQHQKILVP